MVVKLFILGCSGSGKSTAARHIVMLARDKGWSAIHVNDYGFLYGMFQADSRAGGKQFRLTDYGGFDVLDPTVYDVALVQLKQEVQQPHVQTNNLIIIEFARDDYSESFKLFSEG